MSGRNSLNDQSGGDEQSTLVNKGSYVDHILRKKRADAFDQLYSQPSINQKFRYAILNKVEKHWCQAYTAEERSIHYSLTQPQFASIPFDAESGLIADHNQWQLAFNAEQSKTSATRPNREPGLSQLTNLIASNRGQGLLLTGGTPHQRTVVLLDLLFDLIHHAKRNTNAPIPLYFNLRSWSQKPMPIADWLVEEGLVHYQISRYFMWDPLISRQQLTLVLDGYDEIDLECQEAAAFTLNHFHQNLGMSLILASEQIDNTPLTSRFEDLPFIQIDEPAQGFDRNQTYDLELEMNPAADSHVFETTESNFKSLLEENSISRFAIEQIQPYWLARNQLSIFGRSFLWITGGCAQAITLPDEISFYKNNFRPFAIEVLRGVGIGLLIGVLFTLFIGRTEGLTLGLVSGLAIGYLFGFEKLIKIDRVHPNDRPNRGIWGAARNSIKGGIMLSLLLGLTAGTLSGLVAAFAGAENMLTYQGYAVLIGGLFGVWVGFVRYGGLVFLRHYVVRYELARHNLLPAPFSDSNLVHFLDEMVKRGRLRRAGGGWVLP